MSEELNGKVDLVLADPPYNVSRDREEGNADHDAFVLEDMKDMSSVLGEVMKPEGMRPYFVLRCSLRFGTRRFRRRRRETGPLRERR